MTLFQLAAVFLALVALVGWLNARWLRLPGGVAMLLVGLAGAGVLAVLRRAAPEAAVPLLANLGAVDFPKAVLDDMLAFLLFAGAMQVDLGELRRQQVQVLTLATVGVLASTAIVGLGRGRRVCKHLRLVLDDERLVPYRCESLCEHACHRVKTAARWYREDQANAS
jgi:CPA1 family monovalent cation:H+ antiporter